MEKNRIIITCLSVACVAAIGAAVYFANRCGPKPDVPPIYAMRHPVPEADSFIGNYLRDPSGIAQHGWLVNSSELLPFLARGKYVHISLAKVSPGNPDVTLVISGATQNYDHVFPNAPIVAGGPDTAYALESVHPCPYCYDLRDDAHAGFMVNERLAPQQAAQRVP
jgi:hypothetical protein